MGSGKTILSVDGRADWRAGHGHTLYRNSIGKGRFPPGSYPPRQEPVTQTRQDNKGSVRQTDAFGLGAINALGVRDLPRECPSIRHLGNTPHCDKAILLCPARTSRNECQRSENRKAYSGQCTEPGQPESAAMYLARMLPRRCIQTVWPPPAARSPQRLTGDRLMSEISSVQGKRCPRQLTENTSLSASHHLTCKWAEPPA